MMTQSWLAYLARHTPGYHPDMQQQELAQIWGVDSGTITKWREGGRPGWEQIVKVARRLDRNAPEAMVAAGRLGPDDVAATVFIHESLSELSRFEIVEEISRRLRILDEMTAQFDDVGLRLVQEEPPGEDV
jgi:hypothetical protein